MTHSVSDRPGPADSAGHVSGRSARAWCWASPSRPPCRRWPNWRGTYAPSSSLGQNPTLFPAR